MVVSVTADVEPVVSSCVAVIVVVGVLDSSVDVTMVVILDSSSVDVCS